MKTAIISPHTDDAIFSLGNAMQTMENVTIISPFAGVPAEPIGYKKHTILRAEHEIACKIMGAKIINGDFFDDVYGQQDKRFVFGWIKKVVKGFDAVYVPIGIHHPDHLFIRDICLEAIHITHFYEELPYRILYPNLADMVVSQFSFERKLQVYSHTPLKEQAVKAYASQIIGHHILPQLFVDERVWT